MPSASRHTSPTKAPTGSRPRKSGKRASCLAPKPVGRSTLRSSATLGPPKDIRGKYRQGKWSPEKQAEAIEEFYRIAFGHPAVGVSSTSAWATTTRLWMPKQCLLDEIFQPKPAWERLKRLIKEEWNTRQSGSADAAGRLCLSWILRAIRSVRHCGRQTSDLQRAPGEGETKRVEHYAGTLMQKGTLS